ncbi:MAG: exo-alpha-sialidase [Chitinophagaceae bacterium]
MIPIAALSCHTQSYRILDSGRVLHNAPFKSCHAATVVATGRDTLLYAWFGGDHESAKDVCIWARFRYLKNNRWGELIKLAEGKNTNGDSVACWNPVLFLSKSGQLFLDYKVGPNPREWWAERKISLDHGKTWSTAQKLPDNFLGPVRNKPFQRADGTILYPSSTESKDEKTWQVHLERSDQYGKHWQYISIDCDSFGVIQPTILQYRNRLQMLCRSRQNVIVQTWSSDNGNTWSTLSPIRLPNPNSGIDAVSLHDGTQMLVYNPMVSGKDWWLGRAILKIAVSANGNDWKDVLTLENHGDTGEYSYPAIIESTDHIVHIAYTDDRKNIKFVDIATNQ